MTHRRLSILGRSILLAGDAGVVAGAFLLAYAARLALLRVAGLSIKPTALADYQALLPFVITIKLLCLHLCGLYGRRSGTAWPELLRALPLATALLLVGIFWNKAVDYSRLVFLLDLALCLPALGAWRALAAGVLRALRRRGLLQRRLLVVGRSPVADRLVEQMQLHPELGLSPAGFLVEQVTTNPHPPPAAVLGKPETLVDAVQRHKVDALLLAEPIGPDCTWLPALAACEEMGLELKLVPTFASLVTGNTRAVDLAGEPLLAVQPRSIVGWNRLVKEVEDFLLAALLLLCTGPFLLLISLLIKRDSAGPTLFAHDRIGRHGKRFTMYKFRTMRQGADQELAALAAQNEKQGAIFKIADDPRVTRVGRWLRATSLDELPQLLNVLKGEMSLVGPRPLPPYEVDLDDKWHQARMQVLPGITGLWQVNGRSETSFEQMVQWDLAYTRDWSLWLDFTILLRTIPAVLFRRGAC